MIFSVNIKKILAWVLVAIVLVVLASMFFVYKVASSNQQPLIGYTIVLDAGHGGIDAGSVGVSTGVTESELSLVITNKLQSLLIAFGFNVVLTRTDSNGLYSETAISKKLSDMQARSDIIDNANADMVVSIHLNSWPNQSQIGSQCFYQQGSYISKLLAESIQEQMYKQVAYARQNANFADLYILQCTTAPSVVVECGFLSNPIEEHLLITDSHQQAVAYSIFCGVLKFFQIENQQLLEVARY